MSVVGQSIGLPSQLTFLIFFLIFSFFIIILSLPGIEPGTYLLLVVCQTIGLPSQLEIKLWISYCRKTHLFYTTYKLKVNNVSKKKVLYKNRTLGHFLCGPKMLSFFGKKGQLTKIPLLPLSKRSLLDHQLLDDSFGQPHPGLFCRTFGQGRAVQKCCPFLLLT